MAVNITTLLINNSIVYFKPDTCIITPRSEGMYQVNTEQSGQSVRTQPAFNPKSFIGMIKFDLLGTEENRALIRDIVIVRNGISDFYAEGADNFRYTLLGGALTSGYNDNSTVDGDITGLEFSGLIEF